MKRNLRKLKQNKKRHMLKQMIIRLPATTDFDALPEETQLALRGAKIELVGLLSGSKPHTSKVLVLILTKMTKPEITALFTEHELTWTVLATEHKLVKQTQILKFMADDTITDLTGLLSCVSGHKWTYE